MHSQHPRAAEPDHAHPDNRPDCHDQCVELTVPASRIAPGDFLPPQRALHGSRFQRDGFVVGPAPRDVTELAVLSGRVLLFGPSGTLDSLPVTTEVTVCRRTDEVVDEPEDSGRTL